MDGGGESEATEWVDSEGESTGTRFKYRPGGKEQTIMRTKQKAYRRARPEDRIPMYHQLAGELNGLKRRIRAPVHQLWDRVKIRDWYSNEKKKEARDDQPKAEATEDEGAAESES